MKDALFFLLFALLCMVSAKCPVGSVQGFNFNDCYFFNGSPEVWLKVGM